MRKRVVHSSQDVAAAPIAERRDEDQRQGGQDQQQVRAQPAVVVGILFSTEIRYC
jgi:hypothetical protein